MLPLVDAQPRAAMPRSMSRSANLDTYPHRRSQPRVFDSHQRIPDLSSSFPRAFPIRTSQSYRRASQYSSAPYPPRTEHHLRRKSPSEVADAAYDASSVRPILGPQPLTHGIEHAGPDPGCYIPPEPHFYLPHQSWDPLPGVPTPQGRQGHPIPDGPPWIPNHDPWGYYRLQQGVSPTTPYQHSQLGSLNPFANPYQPVLRANEYNVRAFCPPPMPTSDFLPFGQNGWQPGPSLWDQERLGFQSIPPNLLTPGGPLTNHDLGPERSHATPAVYNGNMDYPHMPGRSSSHLNVESLTLDPGMAVNGGLQKSAATNPMGFREKAIAQAHRSYIGLLAHMQNIRKTQQSRNGDRPHGSARQIVYPKPPNPISSTAAREGGLTKPFPTPANKLFGLNGPAQDTLFEPQRRHPIEHSVVHQPSPRSSFPPPSGDYISARNKHSFDPQSQYGLFHTRNPTNMHAFEPASPIDHARSSLEVLNTLCEQSGWQWIDGILLGGCLHFGLENYDSALNWFSRITVIDPRHVVAISNIAATLYCLGRHDEAENHWIRAVNLQPAYLESVEHLVGLYRKRSKEAIDIITFVQQSLRLRGNGPSRSGNAAGRMSQGPNQRPDPLDSPHHANPNGLEADGFGSSGYALPGSENGRILALAHAKGTMLYGMKDIDGASEAFEEAVLIGIGRHANGIHHLVRRIQAVLSPTTQQSSAPSQPPQPLLLAPEKARQTARLVFGGNGDLPGLAFVAQGAPKRAASQTTSNSLLSLAKIFQDAMSSGASRPSVLQRPSGVGDILALYYLSLSLQESPSTANNVGILLAGVQQAVPHPTATNNDLRSPPVIPGVPPGSGLALALAYYQYGLRLDSKHVHLYTNLGSLFKDIGQLDLAIQMYEQAVSCDGTFDIALTNLANAVKDRGRIKDAISYYKRAVKSNPEFAEAVCGLLTALNSVCDWRGRGGVILDAGHFDRWHVDEDGALVDARASRSGSGLTQRVVDIVGRQLHEVSHWGCNILQEDVIVSVARQLANTCDVRAEDVTMWLRRWRGKPWEGSRLVRLVERASSVMLRKRYQSASAGAPQRGYPRLRLPPNLTIPSAPTVLPFHTFTCPLGPKEIRAISQRNALRITCSTLKSPWVPVALPPAPPPPKPHLNIGYVSSDFNNHPLAHLMQSVFGFHDPKRARAICYATSASDKSAYRQKIEQEAPVFRDVSTWSPDRLVQQIVDDQVHILVNLNGYTRGARNEIFAARPAPVQVSFMGFAGTLGAEWCDYILADTTAVPPETLRPWRKNTGIEDVFRDDNEGDGDGWVYSENIIFCRDTFFCCDHAQSCDPHERQVTWVQEQKRRWKMRKEMFPQLPDDTIIMGNFNQLYKIEPTTFRSWLRILAQVPKAVLWLLRFPELGETNLRETARVWAGQEVASRLIFTDVASKTQHISRARVCDLFLDTPECNAHTTAADVLWSSTPLLTYPRYPYKMCSRMAASILKGALPRTEEGVAAAADLIARSDTEYEHMAANLAGGLTYDMTDDGWGKGRGRLAEIRKVLWDNRWRCALFDTRRWVRDVETAYEETWRRWATGEGGDIYL